MSHHSIERPPRWIDDPEAPKVARVLPGREKSPAPHARETSWRRIEQRLPNESRPPWVRWGAFATAAAAVVVAAYVSARSITGLDQTQNTAPSHLELSSKEVARVAGFQITSGEESSARLLVPGGSASLGVELRSGTLEVARAGSDEGAWVRVVVAAHLVEGASFLVSLGGDRIVSVKARSEPVRILTPGGNVHRLDPDRAWRSSPRASIEPLEARTGEPSISAARREHEKRPELPAVLEPSPSVFRRASPTSRMETASRTEALVQRPETPPPTVIAATSPTSRMEVSPRPTLDVGTPGAGVAGGEARDLWGEANALVRAGRYAEALKRFDALAGEPGPFAELALYESGRVRARFANDPRGAIDAFRAYRQRYPGGTLRAEVDLTLVESLVTAGDSAEALDLIASMLRDGPTNERANDLALIRASIFRDRGEWQRALAAFAELESLPGRIGDDAAFWAAWCERKLGRIDGARSRLEAYVRNRPDGRYREEALRALNGEVR